MNARARNEGGQAVVLTVVFLAVLLGMAALVLDFGSWYRADRSTQSTADSAALAGAQALPGSTSQAASLASSYAAKNGLVYLDYYSAMLDDQQMLKRELTGDGLHPNAAGYDVMGPLAEKAIAQALARK